MAPRNFSLLLPLYMFHQALMAASQTYVVPPPAIPSLSVVGTAELFPINRIYCAGKNYKEHVIEMGGNPEREPPLFFQKPADAVVDCSKGEVGIPYPSMTSDFHFEGELVVALKSGGRNISLSDAAETIYGYSVGCDLTRRDLQTEAKDAGRPWDQSKSFDFSAPIGAITKLQAEKLYGELILKVNGGVRQKAAMQLMVWNVTEQIAKLSTFYELKPGDIIFTGTPKGVGPLYVSDQVEVTMLGLAPCLFSITPTL